MDERTYETVRDAYLDGELTLDGAAILIGELTLRADQQAQWQTLLALESGLQELGQSDTLPWTRLRVETALAGRERAQQWLAQHRRGLVGFSGLSLGRGELRSQVQAAVAVAGGSLFGWGAGTLLSATLHASLGGWPVPLLAGALGALLGWGIVRWPELRGNFTA